MLNAVVIQGRRGVPGGTQAHAAPTDRAMRGRTAYRQGITAENIVCDRYLRRGASIRSRRFRTRRGEIDLVVQDGDVLVFVEVKQRRTHDAALMSLQSRQIARLWSCAQDYLSTCPDGLNTQARFDLATVDGIGSVQVLENVDFS